MEKKIRIRFSPLDTDQKFNGNLIKEYKHYYQVQPDHDPELSVKWSKTRCQIID